MRRLLSVFAVCALLAGPSLWAADDLYTVPADADVPALMKYVEKLQKFRPSTAEEAQEYRKKARVAMQDAARAILKQEKDKKSEAYLFAKSVELGGEIRSLISADEKDRQAFCDQVVTLLENPHVGQQQVGLAMNVASLLEDVDEKAAAAAYKQFGEALAKSSDESTAKNGKMMLGAARRLDLPGNPLKLAGTRVNGKKFDVSDLKGKVVLVDFWATWCGPCVGEIPNMKRMYKQYHDKGFEIVGLSIDEDRGDLDSFLEERKLPWIILHDDENKGQHPATVEYGIFAIPAMILVGKDGKVLDTHARGEHLEELLEKEFPDAEEEKKKDEKKDNDK